MVIAEKITREEAKARTRQKLVDAAMSLLTEEGAQRFSMNQVARRAGIAQPSFYTHFNDLQELMAEVREQVRQAYFDPFMQAIKASLANIRPEDYREVLERIIQLTFEGTLAHIEVFRLIVKDKQPGGTAFNGQLNMLSEELKEAWREFMLAQRELPGMRISEAESKIYIDSIFALIEALVLGYSDGKYGQEKQKLIDLLVDFTFEHLFE